MLLTQQHLLVMCEICCELSSVFSSKTMYQLNERSQPPCRVYHIRFLKWQIPSFISSGHWLQHADLKMIPVNYKICIEIQQRVCLRKIHNVNRPRLSYGWYGFKQNIIDNTTDEWCKRL